ncbi:cytochrome c [Gemmatimonas sp.]|uniref:c-type cytochrome n=1 Tax=Gemmatimonas sp. TaxID=1962908 RepID=UPI0025BB94EF|nr:cytochrome c [Gemmatimonas sp.]MCA2984609.1 cytochrome c [Gemmatimonas sp.]MCA2985950.1 cytochrome c [Gemmatimonas sp.]
MAVAVVVLAACGGDKPANTPPADSAAPAAAAAPAPTDSAAPVAAAGNVSMEKGQELYGRCMACHQQNGDGMPSAFPPLAGSEWVTGPASRPIAILLHGLQGEITVKGTKYNSMMMAYGTGVPMTDEEVASVLTYVRASFGNTASAVTVEEVAKVRAATAGRSSPMSQKDLEALQ